MSMDTRMYGTSEGLGDRLTKEVLCKGLSSGSGELAEEPS